MAAGASRSSRNLGVGMLPTHILRLSIFYKDTNLIHEGSILLI